MRPLLSQGPINLFEPMTLKALCLTFGVLVAIWISNSSGANPSSPKASKAELQVFTAREFGEGSVVKQIALGRILFGRDGSDSIDFEPMRRLRLYPGNSFCWAAILDTEAPSVFVEWSYTLPRRPRTWGSVPPELISSDGRTVTFRGDMPVEKFESDRFLLSAWDVTDGDPEGFGELVVRIEGREVARFVIEFYR